MRKVFAFLVVGSLLFAACAEDNPTIGATGGTATGGTGATTPATAADCAAANADAFKNPGTLTIGTGNPAFPPWSGGRDGATVRDRSSTTRPRAKGYEAAVAAEVAEADGVHVPGPGCTFVAGGVQQDVRARRQGLRLRDPADLVQAGARRRGRLQRLLLRRQPGARVGRRDRRSPARRAIADLQGREARRADRDDEPRRDHRARSSRRRSRPSTTISRRPSTDLQNGDSRRRSSSTLPTAFYHGRPSSRRSSTASSWASSGPTSEQEYFAMAFETGSPLVAVREPRARGDEGGRDPRRRSSSSGSPRRRTRPGPEFTLAAAPMGIGGAGRRRSTRACPVGAHAARPAIAARRSSAPLKCRGRTRRDDRRREHRRRLRPARVRDLELVAGVAADQGGVLRPGGVLANPCRRSSARFAPEHLSSSWWPRCSS